MRYAPLLLLLLFTVACDSASDSDPITNAPPITGRYLGVMDQVAGLYATYDYTFEQNGRDVTGRAQGTLTVEGVSGTQTFDVPFTGVYNYPELELTAQGDSNKQRATVSADGREITLYGGNDRTTALVTLERVD